MDDILFIETLNFCTCCAYKQHLESSKWDPQETLNKNWRSRKTLKGNSGTFRPWVLLKYFCQLWLLVCIAEIMEMQHKITAALNFTWINSNTCSYRKKKRECRNASSCWSKLILIQNSFSLLVFFHHSSKKKCYTREFFPQKIVTLEEIHLIWLTATAESSY